MAKMQRLRSVFWFAKQFLERLSGNSEEAPFRDPTSPLNGAKGALFDAWCYQETSDPARPPTFQTVSLGTSANKGKKRKGRSLTHRPFDDDSRIRLGPRPLVVTLAKAKLIQ